MIHEVRVPSLGVGMESALLLSWLVRVGDPVQPGDAIASIETDKIELEVESPVSGVIHELKFSPDDEMPVGAVLALIASAEGTD